MDRYNGYTRLLLTGAPLPEATVTVYEAGTLTTAVLFSDDGVTPLANPLTASADGAFSFYAADGRYDITITKAGYVSYSISDVRLGNALASGRIRVGTFVCDAHHTTVVPEPFVTALSRIVLFPQNAAAAQLQVAHPLYLSGADIVEGVSFTVKTADGVVATGAESFQYLVGIN